MVILRRLPLKMVIFRHFFDSKKVAILITENGDLEWTSTKDEDMNISPSKMGS